MQSQGNHPLVTISELIERLLTTRQMSRADQHQLMSTLFSKGSLSPEEQAQVDRVYECVQKGWIRVVD